MAETRMCAFCRTRPVETRWRPFCSERCKLQDLARWADGAYRVPGDKIDNDDGDGDGGDVGSSKSEV